MNQMLRELVAFNHHPLIAEYWLTQKTIEKHLGFLLSAMFRIPAMKEEIAAIFTLNTKMIAIATIMRDDINEVEAEVAVGMVAIADTEAEVVAEAETEADPEVQLGRMRKEI